MGGNPEAVRSETVCVTRDCDVQGARSEIDKLGLGTNWDNLES